MVTKPLSFLPAYFSRTAILAYVAILSVCLVVFSGRRLPVLWITFGLVEVATFFWFSYILTHRWAALPDPVFRKKLLTTALVIRILYVVFAYIFYKAMTGKPFEFLVADAEGYHQTALWIVDLVRHGNINTYFHWQFRTGVADSGFPLFLSVIYLIAFKSIFVARLVNALLGAWTCVFIYKLARRNFGEEAGRISAILAMLLPTFIYYCGLHLKETTMVFFLMAFAERADHLLRQNTFKTWNLIVVVLLGGVLFFFRTVLAVTAWFALFSALLFSARRLIRSTRKTVYILWLAVAVMVLFSGRIFTEVEEQIKGRTVNQTRQMQHFATRKGGNTLATYGKASIFMPAMLFAPFPTLVHIEDQQDKMMINGNMFTRNVYAFFVLVAFYVLYKKKLIREHVMLLALLLAYLVILALSGFALSERFHVPAVPFLLIFAGYGISQMDRRTARFYVPYLLFIAVVIIGWNWFKLAGRGAI